MSNDTTTITRHLLDVRCRPGYDQKDGKWVPGEVIVRTHDGSSVHDQQLYYDGPRCDSQEEAKSAGVALGEAWARREHGSE